MGMVPGLAQKGDRVCIISGMQTPYLLRQVWDDAEGPVQSGPDRMYQLIGECYIHGVMEGEAVGFADKTEFIIV